MGNKASSADSSSLPYTDNCSCYCHVTEAQPEPTHTCCRGLSPERAALHSRLYQNNLVGVRALTGQVIDIPFNPHLTILQVKEMVQQQWGTPVDRQRIAVYQRQVEDDRTFEDCNIVSGTLLHLLTRLGTTLPDATPEANPSNPDQIGSANLDALVANLDASANAN
eukprot:TRINITY_DN1405_c0_g2_i3.p1 TRINITY_DN1405_c0_g2~~TRINITY_DN1405_c0_g2_i3.p1  ORF type:complete len:166 (+),score=15.76 TRINITY_DN1405_c0_g2_i3:56-553(+)